VTERSQSPCSGDATPGNWGVHDTGLQHGFNGLAVREAWHGLC